MNNPQPKESSKTAQEALDWAKDVINQEANALLDMAKLLDKDVLYSLANAIIACSGRLIVTGMGKSGHIARKLAATLSSTGTPAYFVHPAEASHGDLGQVNAQDMVIAMSNSGETIELADFISYCKRRGIVLVSITLQADSTLSSASDIAVVLPKKAEACPNNLAPTTSTTMMLAFGDALAVVLLNMRNFGANDFVEFHPGGKLGKKLLKIKSCMKKGSDVPVVDASSSLRDALVEMTEKRLGCVGVTNNKKLVSVITDGDLRRLVKNCQNIDLNATLFSMFPDNPPITIDAECFVVDAIKKMNDKKITVLFVVDEDNHPLGAIHLHECLTLTK